MGYHRISKLILLPLFLAFLSSCQTDDRTAVKPDRYDLHDVTVSMLETDGCMIFEDMYFARGEEKDHVFRFKDDKITEHVTCPKVKFDAKNFDDVIGESLYEAVQKVGIPSFRGLEKDHSVTYLCKDGIERSLSLSLEAESEWVISGVEEKAIYYHLRDYVDEQFTYCPSLERCKKIKMGMYLSDVFFMLGRPHKYSESNGSMCCWSIASGGTIHITQGSEYEGTPFFDAAIFERQDFFKETDIVKGSEATKTKLYWSVSTICFNEKGIDAFPGGAVFDK